MSPQPTSKDFLFLLCAYCLLGDDTERLFTEDQNAFLTAFLDDSTELMTSISIRMAVVQLLEDAILVNKKFDRTELQIVLECFFQDQMPVLQQPLQVSAVQ